MAHFIHFLVSKQSPLFGCKSPQMLFAFWKAWWDESPFRTNQVSESLNTLVSRHRSVRRKPWVDIFHDSMRRAWDQTDQVTGSGQRWDTRVLLGPIPSIDKQGDSINKGASNWPEEGLSGRARWLSEEPKWGLLTPGLCYLQRLHCSWGDTTWLQPESLQLGWSKSLRVPSAWPRVAGHHQGGFVKKSRAAGAQKLGLHKCSVNFCWIKKHFLGLMEASGTWLEGGLAGSVMIRKLNKFKPNQMSQRVSVMRPQMLTT